MQAPENTPHPTAPPGASAQDVCELLFRRAFSHHARGEHAIAAAMYELLMEVEPDSARAWHWYGVSRLEQGDAQGALNFISKSITLDATDATAFLNLGNAMQQCGLHEQAVQVFDAALAIRPDYAQAALNSGNSLRTLKRYAESQRAYEAALAINPDYGSAHFNLANLLGEMGLSNAALSAYDAALRCDPAKADVWCNRGNLLKGLHRLQEACASYDESIRLRPTDATVWSNRGLVRHEMGQYESAISDFDQAIRLRPDYVNALCNKATSLRLSGNTDAALQLYDDILQQDAQHAQTHCNRGLLLRELKRMDEAMRSFNLAIEHDPTMAQAYSNRALMHKASGDYVQSMSDQRRALDLDPGMADAHTNMGALHHDQNRIAEAIVCHRRAVQLNPQHPQANWNLALDLILTGDMEEGWPLYEWRLHRAGRGMSHTHHGRPRWTPGKSISGLSILLTHEQGLGDTLQFCRYVSDLQRLGARVLIEAPITLHAVLSTVAKDILIFDEDACDQPFDVWCPMLSLPMAFKTTLTNMPQSGAYLNADDEKSRQWAKRLSGSLSDSADGPRLRIGLCVTGNPGHENTSNRDLNLDELLALLPDCHDYVMLQKSISDQQRLLIDQSALRLTQWSEHLHDFAETAALCACLDLVISVDTSVAHLAAAMGKPTWILLPWVPDWRWLMDRSDTPWYDSVRLFRQEALKDWAHPVQAVGRELTAMCPE